MLTALLLAPGCASSRIGADLDARQPAVAGIRGQRLAEAHPYVLPWRGQAWFFHCRWPDGEPISVSLPPDASAAERAAIEVALRAWERAGLGIRFRRVAAAPAAIELELVGGTVETAAGQDTANTVVDCGLPPLAAEAPPRFAEARLVAARIRIARITIQDMQGRLRPLTDAELTGAALHELGHALGFQGHARQGDTVMVREVERIARTGKKLREGKGFEDPTLRALYALPSGTLVARAPLDRCRTDAVERMARLAADNRLAGPYLRVGEAAGRVFWRDPQGVEYGILIGRLRDGLRDPQALVVLPESRVRRSLASGLDRACGAP